MSESITVVIVDDHDLFRLGLRDLLQAQGFDVVAEGSSGEAGVTLAARYQPDVVVMDLNMPGIGGVEATRQIGERVESTRVLVLTIVAGEDEVNQAILAGAAGYLLKDAAPDEIAAGVRAAATGHALVSPRIAALLLERVRAGMQEQAAADGLERLTERELDVLRLLAAGKSNPDIAVALQISVATAKHHVASILEKLGLENRIEAAVYAARSGLA